MWNTHLMCVHLYHPVCAVEDEGSGTHTDTVQQGWDHHCPPGSSGQGTGSDRCFGGVTGLLWSGGVSGLGKGSIGVLVGRGGSLEKRYGEAGAGQVLFPQIPCISPPLTSPTLPSLSPPPHPLSHLPACLPISFPTFSLALPPPAHGPWCQPTANVASMPNRIL